MNRTIELTPEEDAVLDEAARRRGTTPESVIHDLIRQGLRTIPKNGAEAAPAGSMAEFLEGYVGVFDSRDFIPGGARFSEATGEQFADILEEKQARGHI